MAHQYIVRRVWDEVEAIRDYIARENAVAAREVIDGIFEIINLVTERPKIGRRTRESGVRSYPVKRYPYVVFYRHVKRRDEVRILRVRHAAMRRAGLQDEAQEFRAAVSP